MHVPFRTWGVAALLALLLAGTALPTAAQTRNPRFGLGFNTLLSTPDGLGFGLRGRASAPINADLSVALDAGFTGFILQGRRDATWLFDPQVSAIITMPTRTDKAPYFLAGLGAYVPLSNEEESASGPTIHAGMGWVRLLHETTFYYEVNPALIIDLDTIHLALPLRVGVIF